jgi:hypothetical protein
VSEGLRWLSKNFDLAIETLLLFQPLTGLKLKKEDRYEGDCHKLRLLR